MLKVYAREEFGIFVTKIQIKIDWKINTKALISSILTLLFFRDIY